MGCWQQPRWWWWRRRKRRKHRSPDNITLQTKLCKFVRGLFNGNYFSTRDSWLAALRSLVLCGCRGAQQLSAPSFQITRSISRDSPNENVLLLFIKISNWIFQIQFPFFFSFLSSAGTCTNPLGMESGAIADFQVTASSSHDVGNTGPQHAR